MANDREKVDEREERLYALHDRALLYLRGMGIGAFEGMRLASECLERAGPDPRIERVFEELFALLRERDLHPLPPEPRIELVVSPPLNRRCMVAKELPVFHCLSVPRKILHGLVNYLTLRNILWDKQ